MRGHLRPTNVAPPRFLARSGEGMAWSDLLVRVAASGALRKRIIGALEAGAISMVSSDSALIPDVDVIAIDPAEPTSVRRLRVKPSPRASASSRPPCATVETP